MTYTVAIDPGTTKSAWVVINDLLKPVAWAWEENEKIMDRRVRLHGNPKMNPADPVHGAFIQWAYKPYRDGPVGGVDPFAGFYPFDLVIEDVQLMGMPAGRDVFETVKWAGRFDASLTARWIARPTVKAHICNSARAKDANVKAAIIDRFGGQAKAIGGVKCNLCHGKGWRGREHSPCPKWFTKPGPLHAFSKAGMSSHGWSALALAITAAEVPDEVS